MINHTPWDKSFDDIYVKFVENTETNFTIMIWHQESQFSVYDKVHVSQDQPLYHDSKVFDTEDAATEYAESQLS